MLFSFRTDGLKEEFEIFGAAGESVAGLFDTLRSAALDLTADAVVLGAAAQGTLKAYAEAGSEPAAKVRDQIAKAFAFADQPTEVFLVPDGKDALPVLLCRFPKGLRPVAEAAAQAASDLARTLLKGASPATIETMQAFDRAFDRSVLPAGPVPAETAFTVPDEGIDGGGGDLDADELLTGTGGGLAAAGGSSALKVKKSK